MKSLVATTLLLLCVSVFAQKGKAPEGYYPPGFDGDTFEGKVVSVDGKLRTMDLQSGKDRFQIKVPNIPYFQTRVNDGVWIDFLAEKTTYVYKSFGPGVAANIISNDINNKFHKAVPAPDRDKLIFASDFDQFLGRRIVAYHSGDHVVWRLVVLKK
jgi:hypothetical protein